MGTINKYQDNDSDDHSDEEYDNGNDDDDVNDDGDDDGNDKGDDGDYDDDIYIMMRCVFVCHEKSSLPTSELSAGGVK